MDWPRRVPFSADKKARKRPRQGARGHTISFCGYSDRCRFCAETYTTFRTGLTYQDVWALLADDTDDKSKWRYKRRHTILGLWHRIKIDLWEHHKAQCEQLYADDALPF